MPSVQDQVRALLQDMIVAAGENPVLERETTEIIPLALAHALTFEGSSPENSNLCAQISVIRALRGLAPAPPVKGGHVG